MSGAGNDAFFAGAWRNHQMPQSVFNGPSGALPPANTSGYSNGLNAQADAKINYNSTLLGDLAPYAYGKPGRLSSQTAYLAIPHMLQKVVPVLSLPTARWPCNETTRLFHSVDDGDVAFTININRNSSKHAEGVQIFDKVGALRAIDPFCNLVTVNYLLAGIQMYSDVQDPNCASWRQFIRDIGMYDNKVMNRRIHTPWQVLQIIRDIFIPFGVPRGSDKQGGQSQGTNAPDIFPVDHVTSMLMDGKCQNLVNLWRAGEISAGDDMILVMRKIVPSDYVLSRQTSSFNRQVFGGWPPGETVGDDNFNKINLDERRREGVWQLVPKVYNMADEPEFYSEYDYRENGYWHICRALQQSGANPRHSYDKYNDATQYQKTGELLEVSFQPLFFEGLPSGSSSTVIRKRPSYPIDQERLGVPVCSVGGHRFRLANTGGVGGAGPDPDAWAVYMRQHICSESRKRGAEEEPERMVMPAPPEPPAAAAPVRAPAAAGPRILPGPPPPGAYAEYPGAAAGDMQAAEVGANAQGSSKPASKPASGSAKAAKKAKTASSAPVTMGLSGSYISGEAGEGGSGAKKGSVRASLLTADPPPE